MSMTEELEKQIKNAEIVLKKQGGEKDTNCVSCNAIPCADCFGKKPGCESTYADFKAFISKHKPKPEAKMITREELIEKMKGKVVQCDDSESNGKVCDILKHIGFDVVGKNENTFDNLGVMNSPIVHYFDCLFEKNQLEYDRRSNLKKKVKIISSKEFLSYFNQEETTDIETLVEEFDNKPITKREYLLNLISTMEANKKEFNQTVDKRIEALQKNLCCDGCYIQEDGQYKINETKVSSKTAIEVAEFIKDMESTFTKEA